MKIHNITLSNFRCFSSLSIPLGNITVFTGHNNSGKSSILRSILLAQAGSAASSADVRAGATRAEIGLRCTDVSSIVADLLFENGIDADISIAMVSDNERSSLVSSSISLVSQGNKREIRQFSNVEPKNSFIPYLSKRKVSVYSEDVRIQFARTVTDMTYLAAKLARITNTTYPGHELYRSSCEAILGFMLTAVPSENGQRPGIFLPDGSSLTLSEMGEGVPNIAALLIELATAENKVFIIEEPENDLHPSSLKALLEMILLSSRRNQFIISSHSNIVVQYLGYSEHGLYYVERTEQRPPTSVVRRVEPNSAARMEILRELGYALSDFELWEGWLILEESSAERIVRDFLIPNFAPGLSVLRTLGAGGVDDVEATFDDFHRLVRFTHLEQVYRTRTWVKVDGDSAGTEIIRKLSEKYTTWDSSRFAQFSKPQFEYYYPAVFQERVSSVLAIQAKREKREAKRSLLNDVIRWLKDDHCRALEALAQSAEEVISYLRGIERTLLQK